MLIAFTALENSLQAEIDPRFGRAAYYIIVNTTTDEVTIHDNSSGINASNGAGTGAAQTLSEYGVEALYTGRVGPKAAEVLDKAKIAYYENITGTVQDVLNQLKNGKILQSAISTDNQSSPAQPEKQQVSDTVTAQCPGAIPAGTGYRMAGRGMGAGRGAGRGMGAGRGRGMCHR